MKICLATNNAHKVRELESLLPGMEVVMPGSLGLEFSFEENGLSFLENSLGKALSLVASAGMPVLADDSGLCVDGLGGVPGIRSARYGEDEGLVLDAAGKNALLLSRLAPGLSRACRFVCCMTVAFDERRFVSVQETLEGIIADRPSGTGGFGYDPIVFLPELGMTVADLAEREKGRISHRGKAAKAIAAMLRACSS